MSWRAEFCDQILKGATPGLARAKLKFEQPVAPSVA
jgi:hypothetical protein